MFTIRNIYINIYIMEKTPLPSPGLEEPLPGKSHNLSKQSIYDGEH